jgi:hypothetical protein
VGVGQRTLNELKTWPPGLPVFGQLTPFPATPLYDRLQKAGRLERPKHWLDFAPFVMAHAPLKMSIAEAHAETKFAWASSYSPERNEEAIDSLADQPIKYQTSLLVARLFFRGIYFPQLTSRAWLRLIAQNRRSIFKLVWKSVRASRQARSLANGQKSDSEDAFLLNERVPQRGE